MSGSEAFELLLAAQTRMVARNLRWFYATEESEGPHQARIALRKLRSLLKLYRPLLESARSRAIEAAAREEARRIGPLRDVDVLLAEILPMTDEALGGASPARERLATRVANHRLKLVKEIRSGAAALASAELVFELEAFAAHGLWRSETASSRRALEAPARELAAYALDRAWKPAMKLGRRLATLEIEERHDLRKACKTLRYAVELHAPLYRASVVKSYLASLKTLQDVFGAMNDAASAEGLREIARAPALRGAVEEVIATQETRMRETWPDAQKVWDKFASRPKFW